MMHGQQNVKLSAFAKYKNYVSAQSSVPHNRLVCCHDIDRVTNDEDIEPQL
jgi:hypothetical protein